MPSSSDRAASVPVVFLHSSMSSKSQWTSLIKLLDPRLAPIALDLHGYGTIPMPANGADFSLTHEIDLVLEAIDRQIGSQTPFHLVGHSYGGAVSLRLAHEQPQRVASLALFEPVAFYVLTQEDPGYQEIRQVIQQIDTDLEHDPRQATRVFIDYWSGANAFDSMPAELQATVTQQIFKVRLDFQALMNEPLRLSHVPALPMPVCLIKGRTSPQSSRRVFAQLAHALPHAQCHEVNGGHMAPITHAHAVNAILDDFLRQRLG